MQTISFYSYKGGVGRTLVVANVAKYLAKFGQKVFALDFDLEAPGLHYKFIETEREAPRITKGLVDYIYRFAVESKPTELIAPYVISVETRRSDGHIWLMPAGQVPYAEYWKKLAQLNWHDLFYSTTAKGIPFFLDLKARIEYEFAPDFLLIDSRTGITEIGGLATSVLPDKVVCLLINNLENKEGTREVMRSIKKLPTLSSMTGKIELVPVLTRIPVNEENAERRIVGQLKAFLNQESSDLETTLKIDDILVLHSDPQLELSESLRVRDDAGSDESPLLRDYLRLFSKLVPREIVTPYIEPLVQEAMANAFDDPDRAQRNLETLAADYPHPEAFRALLKLYRLRKEDSEKIVRTATRCWALTGLTDDFLWQLIREHLSDVESPEDIPECLHFIEAIWRAQGAKDGPVLVDLVDSYEDADQEERAVELIVEFLSHNSPSADLLDVYLRVLRTLERPTDALAVIQEYKGQYAKDPKFIKAWAQTVLAEENRGGAEELLSLENLHGLKSESPVLFARLLALSGKQSDLESFLTATLQGALASSRPTGLLFEVGEFFHSLGRGEEFDAKVKQRFPTRLAEDFLSDVRVRTRRRFVKGRYT